MEIVYDELIIKNWFTLHRSTVLYSIGMTWKQYDTEKRATRRISMINKPTSGAIVKIPYENTHDNQ